MTATDLDEAVRMLLATGVGGDPYPVYSRLREEAPVFVADGRCVVSTYDEVKTVLREPGVFRSRPHPGARRADYQLRLGDEPTERQRRLYDEFVEFQAPTLTRTDDDDHERARSAFRSSVSRRSVDELRPMVQRLTDELLGQWSGDEVVDVVDTVAMPLPLHVIVELLGAPRDDAVRIRQWSTDIFPGGSDLESTHAAIEGFREYLPWLIDNRPRDGSAVVLDALVGAHDEGQLSLDEVASHAVNLLFAGHETTSSVISSGLYSLLADRDQWEQLRAEPALVAPAIEELVRFESPVQYLGRATAADVDLGGVTIPAGTTVLPLLGSANRDRARFDDPDHLDVGRDASAHLGFGFGTHFCLGAHLARLEVEVVLTSILERHPDIGLDDPVPRWRRSHLFRGVESLPVRPRGH